MSNETTASTTDRKSLMLDNPEYNKISRFAKAGGVPRPIVVRALLAIVDENRLMAAIADQRAREKVNQAEERRKRAALGQLAEQLDMEQINKLLAQLGTKGSE